MPVISNGDTLRSLLLNLHFIKPYSEEHIMTDCSTADSILMCSVWMWLLTSYISLSLTLGLMKLNFNENGFNEINKYLFENILCIESRLVRHKWMTWAKWRTLLIGYWTFECLTSITWQHRVTVIILKFSERLSRCQNHSGFSFICLLLL